MSACLKLIPYTLHALKNFWLFLFWLALILYLSFTPLSGWPKMGILDKLYLDKVIHFTMYAVLCFLLLRSLFRNSGNQKPSSSTIIWSIILCAAAGITIEVLQPLLTQYRFLEPPDMIANTVGALAGFYFFSLFLKRNWLGLKSRV